MPDGSIVLSKAYKGLADVDPTVILDRYLSDETTEQIARTYNVTRQALGQFLLKTDPEGWRAAQVARAQSTKEQADDDLAALRSRIDSFRDIEDQDQYEREKEACRLQLSLAQARANRAQWELERLLNRIYGQKQEVTVQAGSSLLAVLASLDGPKIIEGESETL